jgi:hypothetical protein
MSADYYLIGWNTFEVITLQSGGEYRGERPMLEDFGAHGVWCCLLYTSPSPRDA